MPTNLSIQCLPIDALVPDSRNPRAHSERQIKQIAASIKAFGFNIPIIVDGKNRVIAGHGRLLAARKLGMKEVPTIRLAHLTAAQTKAFMIADNRLTENSTWDDRLLAETLQELSIVELDFSLEDTGFSMGEIDLRIEGLIGAEEQKSDPADEVPEIPNTPSISKPGDIWQLGKHRLLCGSALDALSYDILMQGQKADAVISDPPYNVKIDGHVGGLGAIKHREFAMASGEMSELEFTDFLRRACSLMALNSHSGALHYLFIDWRHLHEMITAGKQVYGQPKNLCVWDKGSGGMGSLYRSQHELILVFKHGNVPHRNNVQLGANGRYRTNIWSYPGANSFGRKSEEGNLLEMHPTAKPVQMIADAIMDCTERGDIVLDPFLGSGTTLMAAERVGRICYGMEIDPLYADTIIRRWQKWTGEKALHAVSGKSFEERIAEVEDAHV